MGLYLRLFWTTKKSPFANTSPGPKYANLRYEVDSNGTVLSIDWSAISSIVGEAKNQGKCGSCWAFAAVS